MPARDVRVVDADVAPPLLADDQRLAAELHAGPGGVDDQARSLSWHRIGAADGESLIVALTTTGHELVRG